MFAICRQYGKGKLQSLTFSSHGSGCCELDFVWSDDAFIAVDELEDIDSLIDTLEVFCPDECFFAVEV